MDITTAPKIITNETGKLVERRIVLVEGQDDKFFFEELLQRLNISNCQVESYGGKDNLGSKLRLISKDPSFFDLQVLIITRDADEEPEQAFESMSNFIRRIGLTPPVIKNTYSGSAPIDVGIFLISGSDGRGMLEDLCLNTVLGHPAMPCVEAFSICTVTLPQPPNNTAKSKAQAYLAAMGDYVKDVGIAAKKGYWNFDSETLGELRGFLLRLHNNN